MSAKPVSPSLADNPLCSDWLSFTKDGRVLLKTAKVEIGQGILTALVQIAADELDIAPDRFDVLSGNTASGPEEAATSSSLSIEVTGAAVRHAASAVRHILVREAAKLLQADIGALSVVNGVVHVDGRESSLTLWSIVGDIDLVQPVADHSAPKAVAARHWAGQSLARIDLREKAAGTPFIHDIALEGMRHGRVVQPPSPDQRLLAFDEDALARAFPDVVLVRNGSFVGLIADDEATAINAHEAACARAEWSTAEAPANSILETLEAFDGSPEIVISHGDAAAMTDRRIALTITKPYTAHASIGPSCAIATWRGLSQLEVLSHTQGPHGLADGLALVFGLDARRDITVIHKPGAGTYGHSGQDDVALDAALLAKAVPGTPVRVVWSRADDFQASPMGPAMVVDVAGTLDDGGRITSLTIEPRSQPHARRPGRGGFAEFPNAALIDPPLPVPVPADVPSARSGGADRNATPLYSAPHVLVQKRILSDWPVRTSALRGLGAYANIHAIEALMDELAAAAGQCPVAFRVAHLEDKRAAHVINRAAEMAGWPGQPNEGEAIGIGFAQYKNKSAYCAMAVKVRLEDEVRLVEAWAAVDAGEVINPDGLKNQVEGAFVQAASWTLKEAVAIDGARIAIDGWEAYPILRFSEVPPMTVELIDRPNDPPLGVGETAIGPAGAAIGNAVARALGLRITDLPLTGDRIAAAING